MRVAVALHTLCPNYSCTGPLDESTKEEYDARTPETGVKPWGIFGNRPPIREQYEAITWEDTRPKPKWEDLEPLLSQPEPAKPKTLAEQVVALEARLKALEDAG